MFNARQKTRKGDALTPLDRKQAALREKEDKLRQAADQLQRLIEEAPRKREEQIRRRREQLAADTRSAFPQSRLTDRRYDVFVAENPAFGTRRLRSEKQQGKILFLVLLAVVVFLSVWVARLMTQIFL